MSGSPASLVEPVAAGCYGAHSTLAFAAIGDHARLPWRFFARLCASDGSLPAR
jgi:hypothetical protein